jgi:hypothetical protein
MVDDALAVIENQTAGWRVLTPDEKQSYVKAPEDALGWMQQMLVRSQQNLNKLSREYDPGTTQRDLDLISSLQPRLMRLQRVVDRVQSALFLANSDAFSVLLSVRRQLKDAGVAGVDDNLSEGLQRFFSRSNRTQKATVTAAK